MRTQRGSRADTTSRHIVAFRDLSSNPGKYSQAEWTYKHHIGNRSATSAIKMGIIERRNGTLHFVGTMPINGTLITMVLAGNAKKRKQEREGYHDGLLSDPRTEKFYELLPDMFTTKTASSVAEKVGIPKTTMQRIFRKDKRFYRIRHGTYSKDTAVANGTVQRAYEKTLKWEDFNVNERGAEFYKAINSIPTFPMKAPRQEITPVMIAPVKYGIIRRFLRWLW